MEQKTLKVSGMSCGHCVNSIEGNVSKLDGVEAVKVHLSEGKVDVSYDSASIELEKKLLLRLKNKDMR